MNTMKKLFLMSGLSVLSATVFSVPVKIANDNPLNKELVAHFSRAAADGRMSEPVKAGETETVEFGVGALTITWKDGATIVDTDDLTVAANSTGLQSSSDDDNADGTADKLS